MKKPNRFKIIAIIALSLVIILEIVWVLRQRDPADTQQQVQVNTEASQTQDMTVPAVTDQQATVETSAATEPTVTEPAATEPAATDPKVTEPEETSQDTKPSGSQAPQSKPNKSHRFPYTIAGSTLVIEQINSYDGIFFEDGSDREVTNVTAIVLTNTGDVCVEYVEITLDRDGTKLKFTASAIEAGATVIALETEGKQFKEGDYSNCTAEIATVEKMVMSQDQIRVEETPEGGLLVTNLTNTDIPCIRIFYKFYMYDEDVYVGGITYTAKVVDLAAESSCVITPSHYLQGYSKVVMIKTYETAD